MAALVLSPGQLDRLETIVDKHNARALRREFRDLKQQVADLAAKGSETERTVPPKPAAGPQPVAQASKPAPAKPSAKPSAPVPTPPVGKQISHAIEESFDADKAAKKKKGGFEMG